MYHHPKNFHFDKFTSLIQGKNILITRAQPKAGPGHKMQTVSFFQRYIVRDISLTEIYRWLIEILSAILKSTRHGGQSRKINYSFLGNDTFPNL